MPAAPVFEVPSEEPTASAVRQHAIGPDHCRWILADEAAGADALMCGAPAESRRPFCAGHCARAYMKAEEDEDEAEPETQTEEETEGNAPEEEHEEAVDERIDDGNQS
jgi:hypothetical protein